MNGTEQAWARILDRRLVDCIARYDARIDEAIDRASVACWDRGGWAYQGISAEGIQRALDAWEHYREAEAPQILRRLEPARDQARDDLGAIRAGSIPSGYRALLPDRQTHCRAAECGRPRRRHIPVAQLRQARLTQPPNLCQACGWEDEVGAKLELDHLAELVFGGADHAFNLIRVCSRCHRRKPIWPDETPGVQRILALEHYGIAA